MPTKYGTVNGSTANYSARCDLTTKVTEVPTTALGRHSPLASLKQGERATTGSAEGTSRRNLDQNEKLEQRLTRIDP